MIRPGFKTLATVAHDSGEKGREGKGREGELSLGTWWHYLASERKVKSEVYPRR
jgi:hypothetical protein